MKTEAVRRGVLVEWPTLCVGAACYIGFFVATGLTDKLGLAASCLILTLALTLHSSFSHEVLHGHPFRSRRLNEALVFPAIGLLIPFGRFRDSHLAHHNDPLLTDPYDDPETNFVDPANWANWCALRRAVYSFNNTLFGRVTIGPLIGMTVFYHQDAVSILRGDRKVAIAYLQHLAGCVPVLLWLVFQSDMPFWAYLVCVYCSLSILKIRTFLEHQAHEHARCRSVIIERGGIFSLLFLNNNLHAVHHARPTVPWYRLPVVYADHRDRFLRRNGGYSYPSYREVFRRHFLHAKDPVPHSLWAPREPVRGDAGHPAE